MVPLAWLQMTHHRAAQAAHGCESCRGERSEDSSKPAGPLSPFQARGSASTSQKPPRGWKPGEPGHGVETCHGRRGGWGAGPPEPGVSPMRPSSLSVLDFLPRVTPTRHRAEAPGTNAGCLSTYLVLRFLLYRSFAVFLTQGLRTRCQSSP